MWTSLIMAQWLRGSDPDIEKKNVPSISNHVPKLLPFETEYSEDIMYSWPWDMPVLVNK